MGKELEVLGMTVEAVVRKDKDGKPVDAETNEFKITQKVFHEHMEAATKVAAACLQFAADKTVANKKPSSVEITDDTRRITFTVSGEKQERNPQTGETTTVFGKSSMRVSEKLPTVLRCGENTLVDKISKQVADAFKKK